VLHRTDLQDYPYPDDLALSAVANGGKLMQPYVVRQIIDSEGNVKENITRPLNGR